MWGCISGFFNRSGGCFCMPRHPFHIVDPSPWPILAASAAGAVAAGFIRLFHDKDYRLLVWGIGCLLHVSALWWRDVIRESTFIGHHTSYVARGLRLGMAMFLLSEAMFFFRPFLGVLSQGVEA